MKISHKASQILESSNDAATFVEQIVSRFYDKAMEARTVLEEKGYDAAWDDLLKRYMPPYSDLGVPYIGIEVALWKEEVVEEVDDADAYGTFANRVCRSKKALEAVYTYADALRWMTL